MGLAIVVAFSIPKEYSASVSLASELQGEENIAGGLGSLASMAGINFNSGGRLFLYYIRMWYIPINSW